MSPPAIPCEGQTLTGPLFNEPMRVETVSATGPESWTLGLVGARSERFRRVSLGAAELAGLTVLDRGFRYDGDGALLRLGLQAHALGLAWEFDPYFGLSVSRVDPLRACAPGVLGQPPPSPAADAVPEVATRPEPAALLPSVDAMKGPLHVREERPSHDVR